MSALRTALAPRMLACLISVLALAPARVRAQAPPPNFDAYFLGLTMRVDYFHTGGKGLEVVSLDRVVEDGPWPGSRTRLVDDTGLGKFLLKVVDASTNRVLYSRGFASIYGEWETTAEAASAHRTFHESLRLPWPRRPVRIVLERRDPRNEFRELWTTTIDPGAASVNTARAAPRPVWTVFENGPVARKVDLLILGEGYTTAEDAKFRADVRRMVDTLFATEPFRGRRADFNVRALAVPSAESGVNRPPAKRFRRTPLSVEYNALGLERYILTTDNRALRDAAAAAPYEFLALLVNDAYYGGGGIYGDQATVAVDSDFAPYVFIHEFGHHFAGLGDEYYTSDVTYITGRRDLPEPWEPNVTALRDPEKLKWRDLVRPGTPLPTSWRKEEYEARLEEFRARRSRLTERNAPPAEMDRLLHEQQVWERGFFAKLPYAGRVGAFEGAAYESKGLYRPEVDCIMFSRNPVDFCDVCRRAIERVIDLYTRA